MATAKPKRAARTDPELRRGQMISAAIGEFAEFGYDGAQMQGIAGQVGVTRNLINRYFPGGKHQLYVEAVRVACSELADLLDVRPDVPLEEKTAANISTFASTVLEPSPSYLMYSRAARSADDEVRRFALDMRDTLVSRMALNNFGTADPSPSMRAGLNGFIAFTEAVCESWHEQDAGSRPDLEELLRDVFSSVISAVAREA